MRAALLVLFGVACGAKEAHAPAVPPGETWRGSLSPPPATGAEVVATVNGESIYAADVARVMAARGLDRAAALDELVVQELLAVEARRRGLADDPEVVDTRRRERVRAMLRRDFEPSFDGPEDIPADEIGNALSNRVTWGVILGLVVGKTIGISAAVLLAVRIGVGRLPRGVTTRYVIGAGALGGIGFTVSLFVTELAFGESELGTDARLGVVIASLAAVLIGSAICVPGKLEPDLSMMSVDDIGALDTMASSGAPAPQ